MLVSFDLGLSACLWHKGRGDFEIVLLHNPSFAAHVPRWIFRMPAFNTKIATDLCSGDCDFKITQKRF
jgi:hypothetical protein